MGSLKLKGQPESVRIAADLVRPFKAELVQYLGYLAGNDPAPLTEKLAPAGENQQERQTPAGTTSRILPAPFIDRGLNQDDAIALAYRLMLRDQQHDERRVCLECMHLSGTASSRRCGQWRLTRAKGPAIPADLVDVLQRCRGFTPRPNQNHEREP
ncbi:hypothetical protein CSZ94_21815 [Janthinobacterium sp. ROICE36]|nr:hypothetical protein CSZ94_21815 [Janthinobacterium sp. ROICE36]